MVEEPGGGTAINQCLLQGSSPGMFPRNGLVAQPTIFPAVKVHEPPPDEPALGGEDVVMSLTQTRINRWRFWRHAGQLRAMGWG